MAIGDHFLGKIAQITAFWRCPYTAEVTITKFGGSMVGKLGVRFSCGDFWQVFDPLRYGRILGVWPPSTVSGRRMSNRTDSTGQEYQSGTSLRHAVILTPNNLVMG